MHDREKVVERLQKASHYFKSMQKCGYDGDADVYTEHRESIKMAIALLKEHDADIKNLNETIVNLLQKITEMKMIYGDCQYVGELVRCRDCRWWDKKEGSDYGYCHACKHGHHSEHWEIGIYRVYKGDWFCADGERK